MRLTGPACGRWGRDVLDTQYLVFDREGAVVDWFALTKPLLHRLDPETSHTVALRALAAGLVPGQPADRDPRLADYLVIDVSCPNTANGRVFQDPVALENLLDRVKAGRAAHGSTAALVAKIAPDLTAAELEAIVAVVVRAGIEAMIVGNT